jgi:hypothetical protein
MEYPIKIDNINSSLEFSDEITSLIEESKKYLTSYKWCRSIKQGWLFTNIGYAINIFLYEIENEQSPDDNFIWTMVGDLPAIYLDTYSVKTTKQVIENYIGLADDWIHNVESDQSIDDCFPFQANTPSESINMFKKRIQLLRDNILPNISAIGYDVVL